MLSFLRTVIEFFSPYAHPFEKSVNQFLKYVKEGRPAFKVQKRVVELMAQDLVVFHLWCEKKYKGYSYLNKDVRKIAYANTTKIVQAFESFRASHPTAGQHLLPKDPETLSDEWKYLLSIMAFFRAKEGNFKYRESSNFGALLQDPKHRTLIGDCNQIVTLYVYLFSRKYDISHLQIKVYPGHVCLHYKGQDIEATSGTIQHYKKKGERVLPISELMAVNLLDVTDSEVQTFKVKPKYFLESSRLAYILSSHKDLVNNNLKAAYQNVIAQALKKHRYKEALDYARQSYDGEQVQLVAHNATVYYLKKKEYSLAHKFVDGAKDRTLKENLYQSEGIDYYNQKRFKKALSLFQKIHDTKNIKHCYKGIFFEYQKQIRSCKTIEQLKKKKSVLKTMRTYAHKSGDRELIRYVQDLMRQISGR